MSTTKSQVDIKEDALIREKEKEQKEKESEALKKKNTAQKEKLDQVVLEQYIMMRDVFLCFHDLVRKDTKVSRKDASLV